MKLSQLTTDRAMDVLCELIHPIANIVKDDELLRELKNKAKIPDNASQVELILFGAEKATNLVPIIFKKRKEDVLAILAILNDKTVEDVAKQNIIQTSIQIRDAFKDKELIDFFKSCVDTEKGE